MESCSKSIGSDACFLGSVLALPKSFSSFGLKFLGKGIEAVMISCMMELQVHVGKYKILS